MESSTFNLKSPRNQRYLLWASGFILAAGIAAVVTPRLGQKEPLAESS